MPHNVVSWRGGNSCPTRLAPSAPHAKTGISANLTRAMAAFYLVTGYHHHPAGDLLSLRPAVHAAGKGEIRIRDVRYRSF
jgi:hypothetical protein